MNTNPATDAIRGELNRISDDLHRAKMQRRENPGWRSGNDESIDEVIEGYQGRYDRLRASAREFGIKV